MQLKLLGNSGCLLRVVEKDDVLFVRKTTGNRDYSLRLFRQALKQRSFQSVSADTDVTSPRVTAINLGGGKCEFEMEYCNADDFVSYLQCADRAGIDRVADKLVSFIESGIARSPVTSVPSRVLLDKYLPLRKRFRREYPAQFQKFDGLFGALPAGLRLPAGSCHGDLTFSNVLFTKDKLYLIDFLDNFLETPLQDMVKLRQDTRYLWSLNMYPGSFDAGHMRIVLSYFDRKLSAAFGRHAFYRKFYGVFQVLNFVRILPYLKPAMRPYMSAALSSLAKETRP